MSTSVALPTTPRRHPGRPTSAEIARRRSVAKQRASGHVARRSTIPDFLTPSQVQVLIGAAPCVDAELLMLIQFRAGLRISEALSLTVSDLRAEDTPPVLIVRQGKGGKDRVVPIHPELGAALSSHMRYRGNGRLVSAARTTAWRWYKEAQSSADIDGRISTHTLRHSAARHWLQSGVPINVVSLWLGHASSQPTLIYLQILADPGNYMAQVP